jgi:hypothetical protein
MGIKQCFSSVIVLFSSALVGVSEDGRLLTLMPMSAYTVSSGEFSLRHYSFERVDRVSIFDQDYMDRFEERVGKVADQLRCPIKEKYLLNLADMALERVNVAVADPFNRASDMIVGRPNDFDFALRVSDRLELYIDKGFAWKLGNDTILRFPAIKSNKMRVGVIVSANF